MPKYEIVRTGEAQSIAVSMFDRALTGIVQCGAQTLAVCAVPSQVHVIVALVQGKRGIRRYLFKANAG